MSSGRFVYNNAIQNCAEASAARLNSVRGKNTDHDPPTILRKASNNSLSRSTVPVARFS